MPLFGLGGRKICLGRELRTVAGRNAKLTGAGCARWVKTTRYRQTRMLAISFLGKQMSGLAP